MHNTSKIDVTKIRGKKMHNTLLLMGVRVAVELNPSKEINSVTERQN